MRLSHIPEGDRGLVFDREVQPPMPVEGLLELLIVLEHWEGPLRFVIPMPDYGSDYALVRDEWVNLTAQHMTLARLAKDSAYDFSKIRFYVRGEP